MIHTKNSFVCGKHVSETGVYPLYSLAADLWKCNEGKWEVPVGTSIYQAVRYFRDSSGTWFELRFGQIPRQPAPVNDQTMIARLDAIRSQA